MSPADIGCSFTELTRVSTCVFRCSSLSVTLMQLRLWHFSIATAWGPHSPLFVYSFISLLRVRRQFPVCLSRSGHALHNLTGHLYSPRSHLFSPKCYLWEWTFLWCHVPAQRSARPADLSAGHSAYHSRRYPSPEQSYLPKSTYAELLHKTYMAII